MTRTAGGEEAAVIPVVEETVHVTTRERERARVAVHKRVTVTEERVAVPLAEERVEVERVAVNRPVSGPMPVRQEGDVTIVPVVEEVLVVEKRFVLREEVRITRTRTVRTEEQVVELRREHVDVIRSESQSAINLETDIEKGESR